jgi:hypothetical protein
MGDTAAWLFPERLLEYLGGGLRSLVRFGVARA